MVWSGELARPSWTVLDHISDAINETSNFLSDVLDYGTEPDYVDEISNVFYRPLQGRISNWLDFHLASQ